MTQTTNPKTPKRTPMKVMTQSESFDWDSFQEEPEAELNPLAKVILDVETSTRIEELAKQFGVSERTLNRVRKELGVLATHIDKNGQNFWLSHFEGQSLEPWLAPSFRVPFSEQNVALGKIIESLQNLQQTFGTLERGVRFQFRDPPDSNEGDH